ncbi:Uncharacterized protein OBRU01_00328 [Operophtera brumata]|uniref:Uncharacterized protein n=1 Tax=Operophtera brumata TaxID=104452 RepID=A0A0L7LVC6_OPEBR|nr:Uncharacterized protein OBRU01_00328 [Operophtera brumata]
MAEYTNTQYYSTYYNSFCGSSTVRSTQVTLLTVAVVARTGCGRSVSVTVGEISGNVLMDFGVLADDVIGPLLCNPENQKGWPKIVATDMKKHSVTVGEISGNVLMDFGVLADDVIGPLLCNPENQKGWPKIVATDMKKHLEWKLYTMQSLDSEKAFKRTKFPLPMADIEFYSHRLRNLEGIYSQLRDPRVKRMAHYLEATSSVYLSCFRTMITNVVAAIVECRDIYVYQKPLAPLFEMFEGTDFVEAKPQIRPMFHCIGLLWGNSRYYCNVEKLIPLLREVCNLVIQQCTNSTDPGAIFQGDADEQLMKIRKAISMIEGILDATVEILKLEKVEFCGLRGKILSTECMKVLDEYTVKYQHLGCINYDPADPEDNSFFRDYAKHMGVLEDVDKRLAALLSQGLDECHNTEHFFKFFQIVGDLFHRPLIKKELKPKLTRLLDLMHNNLDVVKEIFDEEIAKLTKGPERPMADNYLPPISGTLCIIESESALYMKQKHNEMLGYLNVLEDRQFKQWCVTVSPTCKVHLAKNLIYRDPPYVRNNFSAELVLLLREIRYMKYLDKQGIPQDGLDLYARNEKLQLVLLLREIRYMKYLDKQGIPQDGLDLYARNEKLQYDLNRLNRAISWYNAIREGSHETEVALIEKEISAIDTLLGRGVEELTWNDDFTEWMAEVYAAINTLQERVLVAQNNVKRGLSNIALWGDKPLHNRKKNLDKIELLASHKEFTEILQDNFKLYFNIAEEAVSADEEEELEDVEEDTLDQDERAARAAKILRIAEYREDRRLRHEERDRVKAEAAQIKFERREIRHLKREVKLAEKKERQEKRDAEAERLEMEEDAFRNARWPAYVVYVDSQVSRQVMKAIQTSLNLFEKQTDLEKGPQIAFMEVVAELRDPYIFFSPSLDLDEEDGLTENSINDVVQYASKYEDYTPLWTEDRQEVLGSFLKYGRVISPEDFDKYRFENGTDPPEVKPSLEQYQKEKFIAYATKELNVELTEDDYEGLLQVMRVMNEVKAKQEAGTDTMFEPLRDIMDLEILPEKWKNLVKLATVMKNTIAPLQATQAGLIVKRVALNNLRFNMYRDQFNLKEMFLVSCKEPYRQIDKVHQELLGFEELVDTLKKSCSLFDIQPPDEKNIKQSRRELRLVKQLWDYYNLVMGSIETWTKSSWKKIDAEGMDQEEPYIAIEGTIKNLMTSLRAVTELQNPAIKDRHWIELMMATKVKFDINDNTTLADLLALSLHKYEEEVKMIVDKELEITWASVEFDYSLHDRTGIKLPKVSEEVIEVLEDNQVTVWQKKLGTADVVIALWFEVQRKWQYLESIFVGSDDISNGLQELLKEVAATPNIVLATNKAGLLDKLEELMRLLNLCEKALNDYLETKRLAYPRFYFVSSADLLDILSNGNNPPAVGRHLTKLYDNLAVLVFPKKGSKQAFEMISKENEEHVEVWLNRLTDCMRYTLRDIFEHSVKSYEDKAREEWVFDWPAQPALVGTQIWWTTETNQAFEKLEEGECDGRWRCG